MITWLPREVASLPMVSFDDVSIICFEESLEENMR